MYNMCVGEATTLCRPYSTNSTPGLTSMRNASGGVEAAQDMFGDVLVFLGAEEANLYPGLGTVH